MNIEGLRIKENTVFEGFWKTKNPHFEQGKIKVYLDLYEGESRLGIIGDIKDNDRKELLSEYLPKHPFESDSQYRIRLKRASYRNFCRPVVNVFNSSIWRKTPNGRENLPERLQEYVNDIDRKGNSADDFFRNVTRGAASIGVSHVLVDSTQGDLNGALPTIENIRKYGIRPFFSFVSGESLTDWGFDKDGNLDWIKIRDKVEKPRDNIFDDPKETRRLRVWTKDYWVVYEESKDKKLSIAVDEDGRELQGVNPLGEVPLVSFFFEKKGKMTGNPVHSDIVSLVLKLFRKDSELDKLEFDCAIPLLFGRGINEDQMADFVRASSNAFCTDSIEADLRYIEPSGMSFGTLKGSIEAIENSIREISLRMIRKQTGAAEAAEAKKLDRTQLETQLAVFADSSAEAELKCWQFMAKWLTEDPDFGDNTIEYNKDFDPYLMETQYMLAIMDLVDRRMISKKTGRDILKSGEFLPDTFDPDEEDKLIEEERKTEGVMGKGWLDGEPPTRQANFPGRQPRGRNV